METFRATTKFQRLVHAHMCVVFEYEILDRNRPLPPYQRFFIHS